MSIQLLSCLIAIASGLAACQAPDSPDSPDLPDSPDAIYARLATMRPGVRPEGSTYLSAVADVNGDDFEEVLVGAPIGSGRAELLSGGTGELIKAWTGSDREAQLGSAVAGLGDTDGDGVGDLAFGEPGALGGRGRVGLVRGSALEEVRWIDGASGQQNFGFAIGSGQDVTGDGRHDLVVGAPSADGRGSVSLLDGLDGASIWCVSSPIPEGFFGVDVALVPDLDGDDRADVLVGALGAGAFALSGIDGDLLFRLGESRLGAHIGSSVDYLQRPGSSSLLLVGSYQAQGSEDPQPDAAVHVYGSDGRPLPEGPGFDVPGASNQSLVSGMRLRALGDLNGDEHGDLAICLPNGMLMFGPCGRLDVRSGADGASLLSTHQFNCRLAQGYHFGTDACAIRSATTRRIVVACTMTGGVVALDFGAGPNGVAWLRLDASALELLDRMAR